MKFHAEPWRNRFIATYILRERRGTRAAYIYLYTKYIPIYTCAACLLPIARAVGGLRDQTISRITLNIYQIKKKILNDARRYDHPHYCSHFRDPLVLALGDCVPVRPWSDSPITCLAELRMVWKDKTEQCLLTGLRLYFLPENTPIGRNTHGEVSSYKQFSSPLYVLSSFGTSGLFALMVYTSHAMNMMNIFCILYAICGFHQC